MKKIMTNENVAIIGATTMFMGIMHLVGYLIYKISGWECDPVAWYTSPLVGVLVGFILGFLGGFMVSVADYLPSNKVIEDSL